MRGTEFLINGEPFYFTGFGKHEDTAVRGKGHDDAYLVHDFQLLDWIGANSFRTSHYPYAEEVLEFADRHGIVVIDETAAVGLNLASSAASPARRASTFSPETFNDDTQAAHAQALRELIARDKNHPSVVMWSIANEPASNEDGAREYFEPLVAAHPRARPQPAGHLRERHVRPADTDRIADLFDVLCLNRYYGWYVATGDLVGAEQYWRASCSGGQTIRQADHHDRVRRRHHARRCTRCGTCRGPRSTSAYLEMYHRVFDRVQALVGEQVWNFADFQTSAASTGSTATRRACSPATAGPRPPRTRCAPAGRPSDAPATSTARHRPLRRRSPRHRPRPPFHRPISRTT